ncbi:MAG: hypothetical protein JNL21_35660 [Myxococcales bacterium]|nr:hypothetical protein [Myxococcales bacterium]
MSGPASVGLVSWPASRVTLVIKLALALDGRSAFSLVTPPAPLLLDVEDETGEVLYPSDFAPYKQSCDVVVIGPAVRHRGPGHVRVAGTLFQLEEHESLGPRQSVCPRGDPTDAGFLRAWAGGEIEPARFQSAGPSRRVPWPTHAFHLEYVRAGIHLAGQFSGPFPRAVAVSAQGNQPLCRAPLALDTLLLAPEHGRVTILFRAVFEAPRVPWWVAVDVDPKVAFDPTAMLTWPVVAVAEPRVPPPPRSAPGAAAPPASSPPSDNMHTALVSARSIAPALPFVPHSARPSSPIAEEPTSVAAEATMPAMLNRPKAVTLPFRGGPSGQARRSVSPAELERLRNSERVDEAPPDGSTRLIVAPSSRMAEPVPPPAPVAFGGSALAGSLVLGATQDERPPAAAMPSPAHEQTNSPSEGGGEERVKLILQEVWRGERSTSEILASHGLTEEAWRELRGRAAKRTPP